MKYLFILLIPFLQADDFQTEIIPFLEKNCIECHGGKKVKGKVDFTKIKTTEDALANYEVFESTLELIHEKEMPPEDEPQPAEKEVKIFQAWYERVFVDNIENKPAPFKARRLCVNEYRNTLRDLLGFDLETNYTAAQQTIIEKSLVKKILPKDPPGKSGFKNDTHNTPLSSTIWNGYSYIIDTALLELFSPKRQHSLERFTGKLNQGKITLQNAENMIRSITPLIHRRPVSEITLAAIINNIKSSSSVEKALKTELKTLFMSPAFIYRGIIMPKNPGQNPVDAFEYAERLSYFLWGSMPDQKLFEAAAAGKLNDPKALKKEIGRMLNDPKAKNLIEDFANQWLALSELDHSKIGYSFKHSYQLQLSHFISYLFTQNRPLMELIDSKTTFANKLLGDEHYSQDKGQIKRYKRPKGFDQYVEPLTQISLTKTKNRGGILTMPGILAMTSAPNRTSPVIRGAWVLERILGDHLPDPPMDVGQVPENKKGQKLTFRERFELHRNQKTCAVCHDKIDPLGFALEEFDPMGRDKNNLIKKNKKNAKTVDSSGVLYGSSFANFSELKQLLVSQHQERIIRNIVRQTMSYSLGRKLQYYDTPTVETIVQEMIRKNGTWKQLFLAIAQSMPFKETIIEEE